MSRVVVDQSMLEKLAELGECAELCDSAGTTIGFFTPIVPRKVLNPLEPRVEEAELERREAAEPTYSTDEVKAKLEKL